MDAKNLARVLAAAGLRPTQQRIAVYGYLLAHPIHPTADTIYRALSADYPSFSRTTIYNSLRALAGARLIRTVNIDAQEQRFDGNPADHGHFQCLGCGEIADFPLDPATIGGFCPPGYEAEVRDVFLFGRCPRCLSAGAAPIIDVNKA